MILEALSTMVMENRLAAPGETLFIMTMPADKRRGIILKTPLAGVAFDPEIPGLFQTRLQGIVRDNDYGRGRALAQKLMDLFTLPFSREFQINDRKVEIIYLHPVSLPIEYPRQEGGGFEWSINLKTAFRYLQT